MIEKVVKNALKTVATVYPKLYRVSYVNADPYGVKDQPRIYVHYHEDILSLVPAYAHINMATLASASTDGQLIASVLGHLGYHVSSGSTHRRSVGALIALKTYAKRHPGPIALAVDGSRGPRKTFNPGAIWLSQHTGFPIVFITVSCKRRWVFFKTWDQSFVPQPFSRSVIYASNPYVPPNNSSPEILAQKLSPWMRRWHQCVQDNHVILLRTLKPTKKLIDLEHELPN